MENRENLKLLAEPFSDFIRMNTSFSYCPLYDSSAPTKNGFNEADKIAVFSKKGKTFLTHESFADLASNLKFDLIECPYDQQNAGAAAKKTNRKAFERTKKFLEKIFSNRPCDETGLSSSSSHLVMPLITFCDKESRQFFLEYAKELKLPQSVSFHGLEKQAQSQEILNLVPKYATVLAEMNAALKLENSILKIYPYAARADQACEAVELGFDVVSGSYPKILSDQFRATMLKTKMDHSKAVNIGINFYWH
jgi:hypothetical protein